MPTIAAIKDFTNGDVIQKTLADCRRIMQNKNSTDTQWNWVGDNLATMYVVIPEDSPFFAAVEAARQEYETRLRYRAAKEIAAKLNISPEFDFASVLVQLLQN